MMDENLQLSRGRQEYPMVGRPAATRSASSEYPSDSPASPPVVSPASTMRLNRLSLSDLSRFGHGNDRLSYLRSSSPASSTRQHGCHPEAMDGATAAISGWQDEPRPLKRPAYNQYELSDSSEILPSDSLSQRDSPLSTEPQLPMPSTGRVASSGDASGSTWHTIHRIKNQYDGPGNSRRPRSPNLASLPTPRPNKRSASQFSLRSLTKSLSKRPRLQSLRRLATNCRGSRSAGNLRRGGPTVAENDLQTRSRASRNRALAPFPWSVVDTATRSGGRRAWPSTVPQVGSCSKGDDARLWPDKQP